jgi:hypothetical protein
MNCTNCEDVVESEDNFCSECGYELDWNRSHLTRTESIRDGAAILREKGLLEEIERMCAKIADDEGWTEVLTDHDWETERVVTVGDNRPRLDGFKDGIGLEHESREQMNVRSHLLWMEAAFQKAIVDTGVFIIPAGPNASVKRTNNELNDEIFTDYFPIECPLYLVEYEPR